MAYQILYFSCKRDTTCWCFPCLYLVTALCALLSCAPAVAVGDDSLPSVISASAGIDDSESSSLYIDFDIALPAGLRLGAGGGNNANAGSRLDVKTNSYHVGLASNPLEPVAIGFDYEHWGEDNALLSDTWRVDYTLNSENWSLRLSPAYGSITGFTRDTTLLSIPGQFDIDSYRYAISASYFNHSGWNATASYTYINYSRDVARVTTNLRLAALLSPQTLQLISVLDKRRYLLSAGYALGDDQTGVDWSRTESALDNSYYTTASVYYSKPFAVQWAADLTIGQQRASYGDKFSFVNLTLNYFW